LQFQGAFPACRGEGTIPSPVSREESRKIARESVISQHEYRDHQRRNLTLIEETPFNCPSCYTIGCTFDMQSIKDTLVVTQGTVRVSVREDQVTSVVASHGMKE
jgi:hypothetical protein